MATVAVELAETAGDRAMVHFFDVTAQHGVFVVVVVPTLEEPAPTEEVVRRRPSAPRMVRIRKNEIGLTDITESLRLRSELERRATVDPLTGCLNRSAALATLDEALLDRRHGTAVMFMDLDGFKSVNDELGHGVGDRVLVAVASRLREAIRGGDVVGRVRSASAPASGPRWSVRASAWPGRAEATCPRPRR